ncbi:MAG: hypothetical protein J7L52_08745 [Thermotogae bacterium]|nr:hypothetical protein [Thermotogota bacterium]
MRKGYVIVYALTILVVISIFIVVVLVASSNVMRVSTLSVVRQTEIAQKVKIAPVNLLMLSIDYYSSTNPLLTDKEIDAKCKNFLKNFVEFLQKKEDGEQWIEVVKDATTLQRWARLSDDLAEVITELQEREYLPVDESLESYVFAIENDRMLFVARVGNYFSYATFCRGKDCSYVYMTLLYTPAPVRLSGSSGWETVNFYGPLTLPSTSLEMLSLADVQFHGPVRINGVIKTYNCSNVEFHDSVEFGEGGPITLRLSNTTYHGTLTVNGDFICEWASVARFYGPVYVSHNMEFRGNQINVVYFYKPVHVADTLTIEYYTPTFSFEDVVYLSKQPVIPPGGFGIFKKGYEMGEVDVPTVERVPDIFDNFSADEYMDDIESQTTFIEEVIESGASGITGLRSPGKLTVSYNYLDPKMYVRILDDNGTEYVLSYVPSSSPPYNATIRCGSKLRNFSFNGVIMADDGIDVVAYPGVDMNVLKGSLGIFSRSSIQIKVRTVYEFLTGFDNPAIWRDKAMDTDDNTVLSLVAMRNVKIDNGVDLVMAVMHSLREGVTFNDTSIFGGVIQKTPLDITGKSINFVHDLRLSDGNAEIIGELGDSEKGRIHDLRW